MIRAVRLAPSRPMYAFNPSTWRERGWTGREGCRECTTCARDCECYEHGNDYVSEYEKNAEVSR